MTGGDSCYFAFITDYGNQIDLENCPVAFISPTDFDNTKPKQSKFLFANNIKEFLLLMVSIEYAEHLRFQNIYDPSINSILNKAILDFNNEQSEEEIALKNKTKDRIIKEFELKRISDFYNHFESIKQNRNRHNHLHTLDGLNIVTDSTNDTIEIIGQSIEDYALKYKDENGNSILVAIRNAPFKFSYTNSEFDKYKTSLIDVFENLNLKREKRIQEFEVKMDGISSEWMKVRKQIIKDER